MQKTIVLGYFFLLAWVFELVGVRATVEKRKPMFQVNDSPLIRQTFLISKEGGGGEAKAKSLKADLNPNSWLNKHL